MIGVALRPMRSRNSLRRDVGRVGTQAREVGVDDGAPETAPVTQCEPPAVGELEREPVPFRVRRRVLVDGEPPRHPEVQEQDRAVVRGLEPHRLAAPVRGGQRAPDQRVGDLAGGVGPRDVGVRVVDGDDLATEGLGLDEGAGAFGFRELGHRHMIALHPREETTMDHAATVRSFYEKINAGDIDSFGALLAEDFVEHEETPGLAPTKEGVTQFFRMYKAAFPDLRMDPEDVLVSGDKVVARVRATGTHEGEFMGMPATGRSVDIALIDIIRFGDDGLAHEHWGVVDTMAMMQQLGAVPEPA